LRPEEVLPDDLLPEDLLPDDLLPEERDGLLFVVLLPLDPEDLVEVPRFLSPLLRFRVELFVLLFVLLLLELPLLLFPESLFERADDPERDEDFLSLVVVVDLLRVFRVLLFLVALSDSRARTRLSSSEPRFFLPVPRWFVDLVPVVPRSYLLSLLSDFKVLPLVERSLVRVVLRVEFWFVVLALRVAP